MINPLMRPYTYFLLSADTNDYGQQTLIKDEDGNPIAQGTVRMSISIASQAIQDSIVYKSSNFIGLTHDADVNDRYVIRYGDKFLKVQYVSPGRFNIAFLGDYNG